MDNGAAVGGSDELSIDSAEERNHFILAAEFVIFAFNVSWAEFANEFCLNAIKDCTV